MNFTLKGRVLVGIGQAYWSADIGETLIVRSIGSSGALALYDPTRHVGGLLHWLVPESDIDPARARQDPGIFAETGIPYLIRGLESLGVDRRHLCATLAGAARLREGGTIDVGPRNLRMARELLRGIGIALAREDTGGDCVRELSLEIGSGRVEIRRQNL